MLIALFLPWFGFSSLGAGVRISGTTAHGYLVLAVAAAALAAVPAALPALRSRHSRR